MENITVFKTKLLPFEVCNLILNSERTRNELVYEEYFNFDEGKQMAIMVFEKFYFRTNSMASMTIIIENTIGENLVKCIPSGGGEGLLANDWGSGKHFVNWVKKFIEAYIIE